MKGAPSNILASSRNTGRLCFLAADMNPLTRQKLLASSPAPEDARAVVADGIADERDEGELARRVTAPERERGRDASVLRYPASADPIRQALPAQPRTLTGGSISRTPVKAFIMIRVPQLLVKGGSHGRRTRNL